jgi:hypothetical protein
MITIYRLIRTDNGLPIYVGKTKRPPQEREKEHVYDAANSDKDRALYVHKCIAAEKIPYRMEVVLQTETDDKDAEYSILVDTLTHDNDLRNVKMGDKESVDDRYEKAMADSKRIKQLNLTDYKELKEYDLTAKGIKSTSREIARLEKYLDTQHTEAIVVKTAITRYEREIGEAEKRQQQLRGEIERAPKLRDERIISLADGIAKEHGERDSRIRESIESAEREITNGSTDIIERGANSLAAIERSEQELRIRIESSIRRIEAEDERERRIRARSR